MIDRRSRSAARPLAYTLIELLIVIALLGVASLLVVPRIVGRDSLTLQAAVRQVIADLSFAQSDALARQSFRRVVFLDDGSGYALLEADTYGDFDDPFDPDTADYVEDPMAFGGEDGRYVVNYDEDDQFAGVTFTDVDIDGGERFVTYDALGGTVTSGSVPGTGGTIRMEFNDDAYEITISPFTGKLTVAAVE